MAKTPRDIVEVAMMDGEVLVIFRDGLAARLSAAQLRPFAVDPTSISDGLDEEGDTDYNLPTGR